jgi:DNA-binding winged helix-turn-helix (wHTH) protein/Tol biopolymer transport system component
MGEALPQGPSATGQPGPDFYEFGIFRLEVSTRSLYRGGEFVPLTPKVLETLLVLVEEAGKVVTKDELMQRVWPDAFVEEGSIANNISILRKTLNPDFPGEGPIATVARRGYRFTAEVSLRSATAEITLRAPAPAGSADASGISARDAGSGVKIGAQLGAKSGSIPSNRIVIAGVSVLVLAALFAGFLLIERGRGFPFQHVTMERLTHSGNVYTAAISPDGRFIVTELRDNGKYGLWLRNTATGSITAVVPSSDLEIYDVTFSRDGNFIYFRRNLDATNEERGLYRVPVLGGTPVLIVSNIDTNPAFSPDERRMAYLVWNTEPGKYQLVVADADGTNPKAVFTGRLPAPDDPAWSSDGHVVVVCVREQDGVPGELAAIDVNTGARRIFYTSNSVMRTPRWLPGGKGLLVRYAVPEGSQWQVGYVSYPAGKFHSVTTDTNSYASEISTTADGAAFVTTQRDITDDVYVTPIGGEQASAWSGRPIFSGQHLTGIAWTRQGRLLATAEGRLLRFSPQGGEPEVLVSEPAFRVHAPASCGEETIVFRGGYSDRGAGIWRSGPNGADRQQVTSGMFDWDPVCSPDGKWMVFVDRSDKNTVKKLALGGASASSVVDTLAWADSFDLSANAHWLVADVRQVTETSLGPQELDVWRVMDMTTGNVVRDIQPVPRGARYPRFTPDNKAFAYALHEQGVEKLFLQPLDGSTGHFMAAFRNVDPMEDFRFSPDGKSIAVIRKHTTQDVVLIRQASN